ncbi:MAG: hypothetical protein K0Q89_30 [Thermomicrobiales bacterium]|jgi:hypothetical protein|nr:hypothetical protein [Thermomicrobiales bacterium]
MTILANDTHRVTNGAAIADLAELGILRKEDSILDLTVGPNAGFWTRWRPDVLVTNDDDEAVAADYHHNVFDRAFAPGAYSVVCWDPPYAYRGTSRLESDAQYGLGDYSSADSVDETLIGGALEAMEISRRLVLVKCQDSNVASKFRDQSGFVTEAVRKAGGRVAGKLYIHAMRSQPSGKKQLNIWGYHSVLLVIEVP